MSTTQHRPEGVSRPQGDACDIGAYEFDPEFIQTLTLVKAVVNDGGGNAGVDDFGLTIGGVGVTSGQVTTQAANTPIAIDEAGLAGDNFVGITGDPKCPAVLAGTVTLDEGENLTCTITNDDIDPTLTLVKTVVNDDGGTAVVGDFTLRIDGSPVTSGVANPVSAGDHTASEDDPSPDYAASAFGGDCAADGTITLVLGDAKTCTITNGFPLRVSDDVGIIRLGPAMVGRNEP